MQGILATAQAALTLVALLFVGWTIVFIAGSLMERKLKGGRNTASFWSSFAWVWDNANVIGIPTLILGALYIVWAMNYGPTGLGGPTLLVLLMMGAAGMLIGFAPSLRRR